MKSQNVFYEDQNVCISYLYYLSSSPSLNASSVYLFLIVDSLTIIGCKSIYHRCFIFIVDVVIVSLALILVVQNRLIVYYIDL